MNRLFTFIVFCFAILLIATVSLPAQQFNWVRGGGTNDDMSALPSSEWEHTQHVCTDLNGNVYALSQVSYTTVYADTFTGVGTYGQRNMLVTSYNCSGQMRWAKLLDCTNYTQPQAIVADSFGHVYVAGDFSGFGSVHIGSDTVTPSSHFKEGIVQFDTNGHFNWLRFVGDNSVASHNGIGGSGNTLAVDGMNNIHLISSMNSNVVLAPGIISHMGTYDVKITPSGTMVSAVRLPLDSTLGIIGATIDKKSNKLYVYGDRIYNFWSAGGGSGDSSAYNYIAEFDTNHNLRWIDTIGSGVTAEGFISGMVADGYGHLYFSGAGMYYMFYQGQTIIPPPGSTGVYIAFVMKTDTAGNMRWMKQSNGHYGVGNDAITLMPNNKVGVAGGVITGLTNFGPDTIYSSNNAPIITVLDTSGTLIAFQRIHGDGTSNYDYCIASDSVGNLYIGGAVTDSIPDTLIPAYHTVGGNTDFFVLKYGVDCSCTSMPVAAYTYTVTGLGTIHTTYTGTTTGLDSVVWHFGDGSKALGLTATHTYTVVGEVDICVTVYTTCGYDIYCDSIRVNCPGPPASSFTSSGSLPVSFNYTGTTLALDSVKWNFGDGNIGTGVTPSHTYSVSGTYTICATAYTACGSNTACNSVTVSCTPVSSFTHSGVLPVSFTYTGSTAGMSSVTWDFGDGGTATGITPLHTYTAIGTYTVCATVHTSCGNDDSCSAINIPCISVPTTSFTDTGTHTIGFVYTGTTTALDSVVWDFGDSHTDTGITTYHTYSVTNTYHVCVTAYNPCGKDSVCHSVIVHALGIQSVTMANVKVYPNPANDKLMVTGITDNTDYCLLNVTGICLQRGILHTGTNAIPIKEYAPGIYILEMTGQDGVRNIVRVIKE